MFLNRNKKNNVNPCKLQFYYIKVGFVGGGGGQNYMGMFSWCRSACVSAQLDQSLRRIQSVFRRTAKIDQQVDLCKLIWVFARRTCNLVGNAQMYFWHCWEIEISCFALNAHLMIFCGRFWSLLGLVPSFIFSNKNNLCVHLRKWPFYVSLTYTCPLHVWYEKLSTAVVHIANQPLNDKIVCLLIVLWILTLKAPRKPASQNVVCLCRLLHILANFSNLFLHTGKQCGPRQDSS